MTTTVRTAALLLALLAVAACQHELPRTDTAGNLAIVKPPAGVAAANPIAVDAGLEILRKGGHNSNLVLRWSIPIVDRLTNSGLWRAAPSY